MSDKLAKDIDALGKKLSAAKDEISKRVIGQDRVVSLALTSILSGGHGLLVGAPGLAKTRLVETLGVVLGLATNRIQFTPDLMPADILGSEILESDKSGKSAFKFVKGPVFCELLMADEINRASPRTQSALLQSMQERQVSIAGENHDLPKPFHVLATQNPIEQEGTYPLPEAQLDRFLLRIDVFVPDRDTERKILAETTGATETEAQPVLTPKDLIAAQELVRKMPIGETVVEAILDLVRAARPEEPNASALVKDHVSWGPGPRAAQALMLACRAYALLQGKLAPSVEDVATLAHPALIHRMALSFAARAEGIAIDDVIGSITKDVLGQEAAA
ncbi:MAG: MoxR family ATPase [Pseudomonadota bacterium]